MNFTALLSMKGPGDAQRAPRPVRSDHRRREAFSAFGGFGSGLTSTDLPRAVEVFFAAVVFLAAAPVGLAALVFFEAAAVFEAALGNLCVGFAGASFAA